MICKLSLIELGKQFQKLLVSLHSYPLFGYLSINAVSIWQKYLVLSKYTSKCTRKSNLQPLLIISLNFETFVSPVSHKLAIFCYDFNGLSATQKFRNPSFPKYLARPYQVPSFSYRTQLFFTTIMDELLYLNEYHIKTM